MELILIRTYLLEGTNGQLMVDGKTIGSTIELPWKENQRQISCIPEGRYELKKRYTTRFGYHFAIVDVPFRSNILIHAFNYALRESKGCIAPVTLITGEGRGILSRLSLARLVHLLYPAFEKSKSISLTIKSGI